MQAHQTELSKTKIDFLLALEEELANRISRNSNYSLRSFAKALDVSPAALSAILRGKRPLTVKMRNRLGLKLGMSLKVVERYSARAHGNHKKTQKDKEVSFYPVTVDQFSVISEPYHYAILELIKTSSFSWDPKWIAKRLMTHPSKVHLAIKRLQRVGLLQADEKGNLVDATNGFSSGLEEGLSSEAKRRFQIRSLEHAQKAIQEISSDHRDNTSMTLAIHPDDLPKAKKMLSQFRRMFMQEMESAPTVTEVYQLTLAFVPLTKII